MVGLNVYHLFYSSKGGNVKLFLMERVLICCVSHFSHNSFICVAAECKISFVSMHVLLENFVFIKNQQTNQYKMSFGLY